MTAAQTLASPTGKIAPFAIGATPTGWLECDGAAVSRTTYATLFAALVKSSTVTVTIATPGVFTWTAHPLELYDPVKFSTTGALPTGVTAGTTYYVQSVTTNTFTIAATPGGSAIATTGTQSGVHTAVRARFGAGDGSTTFNVPDLRGEFIRGHDHGRGVDAARTLGAAQAEAIGPHNHPFWSINTRNTTSGGGEHVVYDAGSTDNVGRNNSGTENRPRNISLRYFIKT